MARLTRFMEELQLDIKGILWFSLLLTIFRGLFIIIFWDQLTEGTSLHDLGLTMWLGLRMSLKTTGFVVAFAFVLVTLVSILQPKGWKYYSFYKIRLWIYRMGTIGLTLLFFGRIPYYRIFKSTYHAMVINGLHDDVGATL